MGDVQKEKRNFSLLHSVSQLFQDRSGPSALIPVPVRSSSHDDRRPWSQRAEETWWHRCVSWLRYQTTQVRWDVERALARLLQRRW